MLVLVLLAFVACLQICEGQTSCCQGVSGCAAKNELECSASSSCSWTCATTIRLRKSWHDLTQNERTRFANGFKALRNSGILQQFTDAHTWVTNFNQAHRGSAFLPWHRYFIWELETQIRNLGGVYSDFALPYWDFTRDDTVDQSILFTDAGVGGTGFASTGYCVASGPFTFPNYYTSNGICGFGQICCLRRNFCKTCNFLPLPTAQEAAAMIMTDTYVSLDATGQDVGFRHHLEARQHDEAHVAIGGVSGVTQMISQASCDDPAFYLLHAFIDYQWSLWQDCHDYDNIPSSQIPAKMYSPYSSTYSATGLDSSLSFFPLSFFPWAKSNRETLTPRKLQDLAAWKVQYERSSFFTRSRIVLLCAGNGHAINATWFPYTQTVKRRRRNLQANNGKKSKGNGNSEDNRPEWKRNRDVRDEIDQEAENLRHRLTLHNHKMKPKEEAEMIAEASCKLARKRSVEKGWTQACNFDPNYEKCGVNVQTSGVPRVENSNANANANANSNSGTSSQGSEMTVRDYLSQRIDSDPAILNATTSPTGFRITLDELLNKRGVKGNECLSQIRREFYAYAERTNSLLALCNGYFDPRC